MHTNKYKALFGYIYCFLIPFVFFFDFGDNGYTTLAVISTFELLVFLFCNWKITGELLNFSVLFIVLLYIFHFGQVILLGFFPETTVNQQITLLCFPKGDSINALYIMNKALYFMFCGIIISTKSPVNIEGPSGTNDIDEKYLYEKACIVIAITFPIKVIIDAVFFILSIKSGLHSGLLFLNSIPNFIVAYGNLSIIGMCAVVVALKNQPGKQKKACFFMIAYFILLMLSGRRSENVAYVCILAFFFIKSYPKKIRLKTVVILSCVAFLFLTLLYTIVYSRSMAKTQNLSVFIHTFSYALKEKNIFVESLREYGNTGYTAVAVIANWLPEYGCSYGMSILYSMAALIPNLTGWVGRITELGNYATQLQSIPGILSNDYRNIGGSLFGELFFNFGIAGGLISSLFLGSLIGWMSSKYKDYIRKGNYYKIMYLIPAYASIIYWIRDRVAGGIRCVIWGMLLIYMIKQLTMRRNKQ